MSGLIGIDREACLNFNYPKLSCRRCVAACPAGALGDGPAFDARLCDGCGLCLAACPVDAVCAADYSPSALAALFEDPAAPLALACPKREEFSRWPCLGFVNSRLLVALVGCAAGSGRQVAVDDRDCAACRPAVAAHVAAAVAEANRLLAMDGKLPVARGEAAGEVNRREKPVSRRAFFTGLLGAAVNTAREAMLAGAGGGRFPSRELSARHPPGRLTALNPPAAAYNNLVIGEACRACGLCARLCPRRAIAVADNIASLDFVHDPVKCDGCGVCAAHCPEAAIRLEAAGRLDVHHVATRSLPRCAGCDQLYQPAGGQPLCLECLLKSRSCAVPDTRLEE